MKCWHIVIHKGDSRFFLTVIKHKQSAFVRIKAQSDLEGYVELWISEEHWRLNVERALPIFSCCFPFLCLQLSNNPIRSDGEPTNPQHEEAGSTGRLSILVYRPFSKSSSEDIHFLNIQINGQPCDVSIW